ncbi:Thiol-disulfide isomerase or thioredoxin [Solimonas aquatica]|uniref:Thiol-disulfide isomerase or thioredoxin n=1 Tax=Solimonas aquatica TaxID=489703 RepID=A0A1H9LUC3_9GAMM|nr:Thiol-disulfide isomerase or thioredoxin [Solimonas aquatica]
MRCCTLLLLLLLCGAAQARGLENRAAPALHATTLDGSSYSLAAHRGELVIVNFWASWCAPCQEELPAFEAYYRAHRDEGLSVLAINTDDPEQLDKVRHIAAQYSFPTALIAQLQAPGYGRIWRLPISFVIDRDGVLRFDGGAGQRKLWDLPSLEQELRPLLQATAAPTR